MMNWTDLATKHDGIITGTGGNCTAIEIPIAPNYYVLVTSDENDAQAPADGERYAWLTGFFHDRPDGDEALLTADEASAWLDETKHEISKMMRNGDL